MPRDIACTWPNMPELLPRNGVRVFATRYKRSIDSQRYNSLSRSVRLVSERIPRVSIRFPSLLNTRLTLGSATL
jgi:hypothetical protein